jgi:hypothetical protein
MPPPSFPASWGLSAFLRTPPVRSVEDVPSVFPGWFRDSASRARDAIAEGLFESFVRWTSKLAAYASTADPPHASGPTLDLHGAQRDIQRAQNEPDERYRERVLGDVDAVTPTAILDAVDAILAPFTAKRAYYFEDPDDSIFLFDVPIAPDPTRESHTTGFYVSDVASPLLAPIVLPHRAYRARGRCTPRHGLLFDASPNPRGHAIIGVPVLSGGLRDARATFAVSVTTPVIDATGRILPEAASLARHMPAVFDDAAIGSFPVGPVLDPRALLGLHLFDADVEPEAALSQIRSLLATRAMFPIHFTVLVDPTL